ncbi:MAG: hypothetical protein KKG64_02645 [Firmicutes bacterium]|nr:hypothetical protein [Bacillota bacterium]
MARVQASKSKANSKNKNNVKTQQNKGTSKKDVVKAVPKREPTKNELMFFRIGISVIGLTLVVLLIVFLIRYYTTEEEVGPYDDYLHINVTDLKYITQEDEYGVFGDFSYFNGIDDYADLRVVLNANDYVYVYFYRSTVMNDEITEAIEALDDIDSMAFLFIDLDLVSSAELFTTTEIAHLNLDSEKDDMFLIFDINAQTFQLETRVSDILIEINKL